MRTQKDFFKNIEKIGIKIPELRDFLQFLYKEGSVSNKEIIREIGLSRSVLKLLKVKYAELLNEDQEFISLNEKGKHVFERYFADSEDNYFFANLKRDDLPQSYRKVFSLLERHQSVRPLPNRNLDQFRATLKTTIRRAVILLENGDLENKNLFFIGDNDLASVAAAALGKANEILVADIDKRVLGFIEKISRKEKLKINCLYYDVRDELPREYKNFFDTIFFDPPYTLNGLKIFLSRAMESVVKEGRIYFCYGYSRRSKERGLAAQQIVTNLGVVIQDKIENFNHYEEAESIGSRSSLYICELTPKSKTPIKGKFKEPIYTGVKLK